MTEHASNVQLPESARTAWIGLPGDPSAGEIWRARWEDTALLVVLVDVTRTTVVAAPVTVEPELATTAAAVLPPEGSTLDLALAVWDELAAQLPTAVLDRHLGALAAHWAQLSVEEALSRLSASRGRPPLGANDPCVEEQARLEDALEVLAHATWVPKGTGTLGQLLSDLGVTSDQLRALPGVQPAQVLGLRRGMRPLTAPQVDALVTLTSTPANVWWAANPALPAGLVELLDQPQTRARVTRLAAHDGCSEIEERRAVAYDVLALAARQTGERGAEDWSGRLAHYFTGRGEGQQSW